MGVLNLTQQEVGESKQNIVTPLREIHQQTLQGVLGYEAKLIIHVDRQPGKPGKIQKFSCRNFKFYVWHAEIHGENSELYKSWH